MGKLSKFMVLAILSAILTACGADNTAITENTVTGNIATPATVTQQTPAPFVLKSQEVVDSGALPRDYTCDGSSATLPLSWDGAPFGTKEFALIMHHTASPQDIHWYWVLYNIPANVTDLPRNAAGIGTLGNNSVNHQTEYTPPCSKGPGPKIYTYTIYALSSAPQIKVLPAQVNRDVLLASIQDITLASATLNVSYTREEKGVK